MMVTASRAYPYGRFPAMCGRPSRARSSKASRNRREVSSEERQACATSIRRKNRRWVQRFTPLLIDAARPCRHVPGDRWFVDETSVTVNGRRVHLYRAIDQFGQLIDVLVSEKRNLAAIRRFFTRALEHGPRPTEVNTDRAPV